MLLQMASLHWCLQGLCIHKHGDCNLDPGRAGALKWPNWVSPQIHLFLEPVLDALMLSLDTFARCFRGGCKNFAVGRCNIVCSTLNILFWFLPLRDGLGTWVWIMNFSTFSRNIVSSHYDVVRGFFLFSFSFPPFILIHVIVQSFCKVC